jgi:UTP--glucose-1-phosphate uridylyltransferase
MSLADELDALPSDLTQRLQHRGFRRERLLEQAGRIGVGRDERNRYPGGVEPPLPAELVDAATPEHPRYAEWRARGEALLREGKARAAVSRGATHPMPLWLMTSEATHGPILSALGERHDGWGIAAFEQCVSLRLTPQGSLFREADGDLSVYATGHGDLPEALEKSGLLARFLEERGDGYVWIANLDNVGATVDAAMLGQFAEGDAPCAVEVVDKVGSDKGGVPVRLHGKRIIAEEFRLPKALDPSAIRVFSTNTFLVRARALHELDFDFTFVEVEKTVGDAKAVQFERLIGEMTVALEPTFFRVPRTGVASRFLPVKDHAELAARRAEIEAVARERGMI